LQRVGNTARETTKHASLIWTYLTTTPLTNGCHDDVMLQLGPVLRSQSLFHFL